MPEATLNAALAATEVRRGGAPALECGEEILSYDELHRRAAHAAGGLIAAGVRPGDRVAVGLPNSIDLVVAVLAVLRSGAVLVPLNPAYTPEEVEYVVRDSQAGAAIVTAEHAAALAAAQLPDLHAVFTRLPAAPSRSLPERGRRDPALIVYTSGTTGRPKGAVLSQAALHDNFSAVAAAWEWSAADRLLLVLPCFHLHGLGLGLLASLMVGSAIVLRSRLQLDGLLDDLRATGASMFFGVPTIYNRLVGLPDDGRPPPRLRLWVSGSAPLSPVTFERFADRFGCQPMDRYGMTECCFALSTAVREPRRPGVVGRPLPGVKVRLVDSERAERGEWVDVGDGELGELLIGGGGLFDGYWRRPEATAAAMASGMLRSGDLAVREADGQFRILGRSSVDIIKTRGFKVGAGEIEAVLLRHPAVEEAAVVGVPDLDQGERVVAVVTLRGGVAATPAEILAAAASALAPHKRPSRIEVVDDIPKTGPGKFKKKELIARLSAKIS